MKSHRATKARTLGGIAAVGLIAAGGLALSSPGFAQRDSDVGEVVVEAMERDGALITPTEEAAIRAKCGETATGEHGISLRGRDGALVCENGKVIDDPEARAIVSRVTERARTRVETVMNDPAVVAAIDGEATRAAEKAVAAIDEAQIAAAVAEAEAAVEAVDMSAVDQAVAEAQASIAAVDFDRIAAIGPTLAAAMADMPHAQFSAEDRAEIQAAMAEARAEMAEAHIDRAEIARAMEEARIEIREAHRERHDALREAQRERAHALRDAQREREHALRDAQRERQRALREAQRAREQAQKAIEKAEEERERH